ncbi:hypothetical protein DHEL01_v211261 [Diaporthe helianthi]|uniref:LysM domain-containing protein n=1 Tax=Diaporthe helianthi TaxID=158607 RepID=A0A2P5HJE7_DIAHE|nr:hypothetical protein DHEL01_v211261 [Diaporthe helianthi]
MADSYFLDWNPGVKADCRGIKVGNAYCVEVNFGLPRPAWTTTSSATTTSTTVPSSKNNAKPSPTQDGLIGTCKAFYKARENDDCDKIVRAYGTFTFNDFLLWNPEVQSNYQLRPQGYFPPPFPPTILLLDVFAIRRFFRSL